MFDALLFLYFFTLHADRLSLALGSFNVRLNNCFAFLLCLLFFTHCRSKLLRLPPPLFVALLMLTLSVTLSFLFSPYKTRCLPFFGWYGVTIVGYLLLPYLLIHEYDAHKVMRLYIASFLLVGLYAALQLLLSLGGLMDPFVSQVIAERFARPSAFAYEPSYYALYMTPCIVMVNYHFLADRERPFFILGRLTLSKVLFINALYFVSTSTSAFFAFAIFCCALIFFSEVRRHLFKYLLLSTLLFCALALLSPFLMRTYFLKFFYSGFMSHGSFFERWVGIENAWAAFLSHPYFGVGLGGCPAYFYEMYLSGHSEYTFLFSSQAFADTSTPLKFLEPMNVLTEVLASLGILGLLSLLTLLYLFVMKAREALMVDRSLGGALLLSVLLMLIVLQFNQGMLRTYVWTHFTLAYALVEKIVREKAPFSMRPLAAGGLW